MNRHFVSRRALRADEAENQGEGDRKADRRFRRAQAEFAEDPRRVARGARAAAPRDARERREMEIAERAARAPAKH